MHSSHSKQRVVAFTGAGISAPSGLATFRDPDGIWARYTIEEVATPEAWRADPARVLEFYNLRRRQLGEVEPNAGHRAIAELEREFEVVVITQNVDNLHERAGSSRVIHLHGELSKARSTLDNSLYEIGYTELNPGDTCPGGGQLRPHVVWFGETVLYTDEAITEISRCNILIVAGTSLTVYPAAGFIEFAPAAARKFLVDPACPAAPDGFIHIPGSAHIHLVQLVKELLADQNGS